MPKKKKERATTPAEPAAGTLTKEKLAMEHAAAAAAEAAAECDRVWKHWF